MRRQQRCARCLGGPAFCADIPVCWTWKENVTFTASRLTPIAPVQLFHFPHRPGCASRRRNGPHCAALQQQDGIDVGWRSGDLTLTILPKILMKQESFRLLLRGKFSGCHAFRSNRRKRLVAEDIITGSLDSALQLSPPDYRLSHV